MNQLKLFNKKIIISAAADGIGWAIAQACMKNGAMVFITDKDVSALEKLSKHELYQKQFFCEHFLVTTSIIDLVLVTFH